MLTHVTDGRARLRHVALKGARGEEIADMLRTRLGVTGVTANPRTGSLLVYFDPEAVRIEEVAEELERVLPPVQRVTGRNVTDRRLSLGDYLDRLVGQRQEQRRLVKRGMVLAMSGALAALAGSNRAHAVLGGAFLLFSAMHLRQNRRTLMR